MQMQHHVNIAGPKREHAVPQRPRAGCPDLSGRGSAQHLVWMLFSSHDGQWECAGRDEDACRYHGGEQPRHERLRNEEPPVRRCVRKSPLTKGEGRGGAAGEGGGGGSAKKSSEKS